MLSLSPRFDLFRFEFPKDFLPPSVDKKWTEFLNREPAVTATAISYLNESIKGITFPGINDLTITQQQHSTNAAKRVNGNGANLGRINVEPKQDNTYISSNNPLDLIDREFTVTFQMYQGLYNYWMLYENIFWRIYKPDEYSAYDHFYVDLLNEEGVAVTRMRLDQVHMTGLDGLDLSYDKVERQSETFQARFRFNNVDFDFADNMEIIV